MEKLITGAVMIFLLSASAAFAHFGMIIPSDAIIIQGEQNNLNVKLSFSHPFELIGMELVKPKYFHVCSGGKTISFKDQMQQATIMGHKGWQKRHFHICGSCVWMVGFCRPKPI